MLTNPLLHYAYKPTTTLCLSREKRMFHTSNYLSNALDGGGMGGTQKTDLEGHDDEKEHYPFTISFKKV